LSALIPGAGAPLVPAPPAGSAAFVDSIHRQNLAVLAQRFGLSTAVGCHRPHRGDDRVYVVAPEFATLEPTAAMVLFDQVRRVLGQRSGHHRIDTEGDALLGVVSFGPQSRAAYLFAGSTVGGGGQPQGERDTELVDAATGMGDLVHSLEATMRRPDPAEIDVEVQPEGSGAHRVVVQVRGPGVDPVPSVVVGPTVMQSAAVAAARTLDPDARLLTLRRAQVGSDPMVVAVVSAGGRPPAMAMASLRDGEDAAAARAAYRAAAFGA
jgi:hypothetical protein